MLAFTLGISVFTGLLFGLAPALRAARVDLASSMKPAAGIRRAKAVSAARAGACGSLLVVSEVAISLMLLIGAGLLVRSFVRLQQVSPGFESHRRGLDALGTERQTICHARCGPSRSIAALAEKLSAVPGVSMRGAVTSLPFTSSVGWAGSTLRDGRRSPDRNCRVDQRGATPDYFRTMRISVVKGRPFADGDFEQTAEQVAIIDEKFAERFWPGGDAVGKHRVERSHEESDHRGVVRTVKQYGLDIDGRIVVYRPSPAAGWHVFRTASDPAASAPAIVRAIREYDPTITVYDVRTMVDRMSGSMARQRFSTLMLGAFAVFALILAVVGVYGVMSHLVTQGAHDIRRGAWHWAPRAAASCSWCCGRGLELTAPSRARPHGRCSAHARDGEPAVWSERDGSGHVLRRAADSDRDGDDRELYPGISRHTRRSGRGATG